MNIKISIFIGKYLIVSEDGHEIVDLLNPTAKYELLANNVPRVDFATGGLLQNSPIVCGGSQNRNNMIGIDKFPPGQCKQIVLFSLCISLTHLLGLDPFTHNFPV